MTDRRGEWLRGGRLMSPIALRCSPRSRHCSHSSSSCPLLFDLCCASPLRTPPLCLLFWPGRPVPSPVLPTPARGQRSAAADPQARGADPSSGTHVLHCWTVGVMSDESDDASAAAAAAASTPAEEDAATRRRRLLRSWRLVAAPMVGASDPSWRMLLRRHGAQLVYTQMLESERFVNDDNYRREVTHANAWNGS